MFPTDIPLVTQVGIHIIAIYSRTKQSKHLALLYRALRQSYLQTHNASVTRSPPVDSTPPPTYPSVHQPPRLDLASSASLHLGSEHALSQSNLHTSALLLPLLHPYSILDSFGPVGLFKGRGRGTRLWSSMNSISSHSI
jgi:hypothetical protein